MTPEQISLKLSALNSEETAINQRCRLMTSEQAAERIAEIQAARDDLLAGSDPYVTICIAWTETVEVYTSRLPIGSSHPIGSQVKVPYALRWLQAGGKADIRAAEKYAAANGYKVLTYPTTEPSPLDRARADILKGTDDGTK